MITIHSQQLSLTVTVSAPNPLLGAILETLIETTPSGNRFRLISAIKLIRTLTGAGLKDSKEFVDAHLAARDRT